MARHLMVLDRALMGLATGSIKRLIVEMPPRHGKSELCSKYFPAWYLATFPDRELILTSATDDLALDFSAAGRDILLEHGPQLGVRLREDAIARHRWRTTEGGGMRAAGIGGGIMGRGAHGLLVDDYCKNVEESLSETRRKGDLQWFMSTSSTRLTPDGWIAIIATRWNPKDMIGSLWDQQELGGEIYTRIRFPALAEENDPLGRAFGEPLWPEQFNASWMAGTRSKYIASGYEWMWEALYQQNPPEVLDAEFPAEYFGQHIWFSEWPPESEIVCRAIACDPSLGKSDKSDYSAIVMIAKDNHGHYWIDADLDRRPSTRIVSDSLEHYRRFRPLAIGFESVMFQELLREQFEREAFAQGMEVWACGIGNHMPKVTRIRSLTPLLAAKRLHFLRGRPGTSLVVEQLKGFPSCKFDDGPDGLEMAHRLCEQLLAGAVIPVDEEPERLEA